MKTNSSLDIVGPGPELYPQEQEGIAAPFQILQNALALANQVEVTITTNLLLLLLLPTIISSI